MRDLNKREREYPIKSKINLSIVPISILTYHLSKEEE